MIRILIVLIPILLMWQGYSIAAELSALKVTSNQSKWKDPQYGISMICPDKWGLMTPSEVRTKTSGKMQVKKNALIFCVNSKDPDQNINIQYVGDARREAPTNIAAKRFLSSVEPQLVESLNQNLKSFKKVLSNVIDHSGGVALELIFTSFRGNLEVKQKQIMLIKNGKVFNITCTAKSSMYDEADKNGFSYVLSSIVIQ